MGEAIVVYAYRDRHTKPVDPRVAMVGLYQQFQREGYRLGGDATSFSATDKNGNTLTFSIAMVID